MRRWALMIAAVTMASSCSDGGGDDVVERDAAVYGVIVQWVVEAEAEPAAVDDGLTVFLEALDQDEITLEVQAAVVQGLESVVTVRFIDDRAEAVDHSQPGEPVREGGLLLGLGPVPRSGNTVEVTVERYIQDDESVGSRFTVRSAGGTWSVRDEAVLASG